MGQMARNTVQISSSSTVRTRIGREGLTQRATFVDKATLIGQNSSHGLGTCFSEELLFRNDELKNDPA